MKFKKIICSSLIFILATSLSGCNLSKDEKNNKDESNPTLTLEDKIENMTLDEKIGQMILAGFESNQYDENLDTLLNDVKVGGLIFFKKNISSTEQLKTLTSEINKNSTNIKPFLSIDQEGGRVNRLPDNIKKFPRAFDVGSTKDAKYAKDISSEIATTLSDLGLNMNNAPVFDIFSNPNNTVIGDRSFGTTKEIVSTMGIASMKSYQENNIIPTIKHFPGHGDTDVDSHFGLPVVHKTKEELDNFELVPFKNAIKDGADAIMVAHIILDTIDSKNPSSLSKNVVTKILRDELNFNGVIITDDLQMGAITNSISVEKASIKSINAGCDLLLIGNDLRVIKNTVNEIKKAVSNNEISEDRIDKSVYRILTLKNKYKIS